jgi:hypothetical protein
LKEVSVNKFLKPLLFVMLMGIWLVGCGEGNATPQQAPPVQEVAVEEVTTEELQIEDTPLIIFRRSGGFGGGREVSWWLYADGRIINQEDNQVQQSDAEEIVALHRDMIEGGFMNLSASYLPEDTCCDRFTYEITLIDGERRHTVTTMEDTDGKPDLIRQTLSRISMLLISQRE